MHHFQLHAPAGDHVGGHRAVQPTGEQAHRPAAHADRQSACAGNRGGVNVGVLFPNLHVYRKVGRVHLRLFMEKLRQLAADILGNLNRIHGELLVRSSALHLKRLGFCKFIRKIGLGGLHNGVHSFVAGHGPGHGHNAEDLPRRLIGGLHVAFLRLRLHINGALADIDLKAAAVLHAAADVAHQLILKAAAVQALEHHLAQLQKQHFIVVHIVPPLKTFKIHLIG